MDLFPELVSALLTDKFRVALSTHEVDRYDCATVLRDYTKQPFKNYATVQMLAKTSKAMNKAVKDKLADCYKDVLQFFIQHVTWTTERFSRKPYAHRGEIIRLWIPEPWHHPSNAEMAQRVPRYIMAVQENEQVRPAFLKLFVVTVVRRRHDFAVQVGLHEHQGPTCLFQVYDYDPYDTASETESDEGMASDSEAEVEINEADAPAEATIPVIDIPVIEIPEVLEITVESESDSTENYESEDEREESEDERAESEDERAESEDERPESEEEREDIEQDNNVEAVYTAVNPTGAPNHETDILNQDPTTLNFHYSPLKPLWIDPHRSRRDVRAAELSADVEAWLTTQFESFFPMLVYAN